MRKKNNYYILCGQNQILNQELEARYERMFNSTYDPIMLLDQDRFTDCNKATLNLFKVNSVESFIKFHPADLSPPLQPDGTSSLEKAQKMIVKAMKEGRNFFEWTHRTTTGEDIPCEVLLSKIDLQGKTYLQATVRDISERIQLQKEIDEARAQQINSSRLASLGELAGGIAHEINNPMAVIRSQAELLLNSLKRNGSIEMEKLQTGLNRVINTSDRITRIIKGLKLLSRDSSEDSMNTVEVTQLIKDTLIFCEERLREKQIRIEFTPPAEAIEIQCRSVEISQVLLNLINNSIDAVQKSPAPWIKIDLTKTDSHVIIKVIDSGEGIPLAIVDKITLPFYTTKEVGKGTGLGLSITKRIIEKHNGEFYLDLSAKKTTFVIMLPYQR